MPNHPFVEKVLDLVGDPQCNYPHNKVLVLVRTHSLAFSLVENVKRFSRDSVEFKRSPR